MLNIDTQLFNLVPNVINTDEFFILLSIAKRIGKDNNSFPNYKTLQKESGFGKNKLWSCLKSLDEKKLITKEQRYKNGRLTSNLYTLNVRGLSVFIPAYGCTLESDEIEEENLKGDEIEENTVPDFQETDFQETENQTISISNNIEVLERGEEGSSSSSHVDNLGIETLSVDESIFCTTLGINEDIYKSDQSYKNLFRWIKNHLPRGDSINDYMAWLTANRSKRDEWKHRGRTRYHGGWINDFELVTNEPYLVEEQEFDSRSFGRNDSVKDLIKYTKVKVNVFAEDFDTYAAMQMYITRIAELEYFNGIKPKYEIIDQARGAPPVQ